MWKIFEKYGAYLLTLNIVFCFSMIVILQYKEAKGELSKREAKLAQSYTVKVLDAQGKAIEIYQGKTFELQNNRLYVCPKGTEYCSEYVKAIVVNSNYIIEPEN